MWYGLTSNGSLISVQWFNREPLISDFGMGYMSWNEYNVVEVDVRII